MVQVPITSGLRRMMRQHQGLPARAGRVPMWRLLLGEFGWAVRQLAAEPLVPLGMVAGFIVTLLVLGAAAPGPVLDGWWRLIVAVVAGDLVGSGLAWLKQRVTDRDEAGDRADDEMTVVGAAVVAGLATVLVLFAWMLVWIVQVLR